MIEFYAVEFIALQPLYPPAHNAPSYLAKKLLTAIQFIKTTINVWDFTANPPRGGDSCEGYQFGSLARLLTCLIAKWYGVKKCGD